MNSMKKGEIAIGQGQLLLALLAIALLLIVMGFIILLKNGWVKILDGLFGLF